MAKLICLTPRLLTESNTEKQFVNTRYIAPLIERGFNTIQLTLENPSNNDIFDLCDGFLITGGADVDPVYFGETNDEGLSKNINSRLDLLDKAVIDYAVKHKKPLLGICRGLQSLNIFLGGTLHQDLGPLNPSHKSIKENHIVHTIKHPLFNWEEKLDVNSYHHQAIKDVADDLDVIARHKDNTIEMVVHKNLPIFAVQWHPEISKDSFESKVIFDVFANLVNNKI